MARYKDAIEWIVFNDDTTEIREGDLNEAESIVPVSVVLVADLWGKDVIEVVIDIRKLWEKQQR